MLKNNYFVQYLRHAVHIDACLHCCYPVCGLRPIFERRLLHALKKNPQNIIISRTDSIGDVVLTLPVAAALKKAFPGIYIGFLGKKYTQPVIEACRYVDEFMDEEAFLSGPVLLGGEKPQAIVHVFAKAAIAQRAKQLSIPLRIGTTHRLYHWTTCNKLVILSRRHSALHEAQVNIRLLKPLGIAASFSLDTIKGMFGLDKLAVLDPSFASLIDEKRYNLIVHAKSQGSGLEWPLDHYIQLIRSLHPQRYKIFISGTAKEKEALQPLLRQAGYLVTDIAGAMPLSQFMAFIKACDGLLASGTGPLHLAAALGKDALGLFPSIKPIHPQRWAPLGERAKVFTAKNEAAHCMYTILPGEVKEYLDGRELVRPMG